MINLILPALQNHPKVKSIVENAFGQPVDHVFGCLGAFWENVKKGPGLVNTAEQKLSLSRVTLEPRKKSHLGSATAALFLSSCRAPVLRQLRQTSSLG